MKPLVSIVCIAYNHEPYIRECLDSFVKQQTDFPIEILVNDDCSKDNTANIIREYELKYPQLFRCVYQIENQYSKGVHPWYDILFPMAHGEYIALCEGDDFWTDVNKLQKQIDILEADTSLMGCCTNRCLVDAKGNVYEDRKAFMIPNQGSCRISLRDYFKYNTIYPTASVVFRNNHPDEIIAKMRYTQNDYLADWILWIAIHCFGDFYFLDEVTSAYRFNPTSVTHTQWVKGRVDKVKSNFILLPRIADILPKQYADIAADLRNTNYLYGSLVKAHFKDRNYLKMLWALCVVMVKYPRYYKELARKVINKIKRI